ncbi:MAG: hypothetical protein JWL83_2439, partial [Actinomycetia bacterium]|nr:hypothetical protein [Actinomycetes bacterium]
NAIDGRVAARMLGVTGPLDAKYLQLYYFEVLQQFAKSKGSNTVITPSNPPGLTLNVGPNGATTSSTGK